MGAKPSLFLQAVFEGIVQSLGITQADEDPAKLETSIMCLGEWKKLNYCSSCEAAKFCP